MFNRLQTKLTVLYAGLFGAAMIFVSIAVYGAVAANARAVVRAELEAGGTVFDRLWTLRSQQLAEGAALLSRDFGFRAAMADGDAATIGSAVDNLKSRLGVDRAYAIGADGSVIAGAAKEAAPLAAALQDDEDASGVVMIDGAPYQAVSAPILSPNLTGWVVFASRLDQKEMTALARLSAIPLDAAVLHRQGADWRGGAQGVVEQRAAISRFVDRALNDPKAVDLKGAGPDAIALVKPLKLMDAKTPAVLLLRYPMARALAPYRPMLAVIVVAGLLALSLLAWGSWALARTLTRPVSVLDDAARRLQQGEDVTVSVDTADEVGRLANRFNAMAGAIREREKQITHLALHDTETSLPNRLALERRVKVLMGKRALVVVATIGIDRFAEIRGAIGYGLYQQLVGEIGRRLRGMAPDVYVARITTSTLGAVRVAHSLQEAQLRAAALRKALEEPLILGAATVDVGLSVGLAASPDHANTPAALVDRANIALDQARRAGQNEAWFDADLYGDPAANLSLMSEMRAAIQRGGIEVFYQPKYDLHLGQVTGVEALVRWPHPKRGMVSPDLFVGMAEETGHIRVLTDYVLDRALKDQAELNGAGFDIAVSVNLSGRLVGDEEFMDGALARARGRTGGLCLEVTETAVIDNPDAALRQLDRVEAAGVEISIDDYGSGLSSLAYLKRIRARELKIDKAFVLGMAASKRDTLLVRSTIDLAHGLGMKVTAEGVEDAGVVALLRSMGCDFAQGYFISRALPLKDLLRFLQDSRELTEVEAPRDEDHPDFVAGVGRPRRTGAG